MRGRMRIHLVTGGYVDSRVDEADENDLATLRDFFGSMMATKDEGWQVNIDTPEGGWAYFPHASMLYVEWIPEEASA